MRVNHLMLCDFAIPATAGVQKASIIGIFEVFNLPKMPFRVPRFFIVFEIEGESVETGKFEVAVRLQAADGEDLLKLDGKLDAPRVRPGEKWRVSHQLEVEGLEFKKAGGHQIIVLLNREIKRQAGLQVNSQSTAQS